jgi:CRP/FNR family cyclic AMP-dependent transcriptional regulator
VYKTRFWWLLCDSERDVIMAAAKSRIFEDGSVLCVEGEPSTHVFILLSGWTKIVFITGTGREILQALCGEGDVVGEIAGQVTGYRTATVRALGTVHTLIVEAEQFEELLDAYPGASRAYRRAVAEQQREAHELQRNQTLFSGSQRLACLLLDLAERNSHTSHSVPATFFSLSQEELASLVGASRSTVTRALSNWRSRRIIQTRQGSITILDQAGLRRIASRAQSR